MTITVVCCHKKLTTSIQRKLVKEGEFRPSQLNFSKIPHPATTELVSLLWFPRNVTITIIDSKCHLKYELALNFLFSFSKHTIYYWKWIFFHWIWGETVMQLSQWPLLHLGPKVITLRTLHFGTLLHLGPRFITFRTFITFRDIYYIWGFNTPQFSKTQLSQTPLVFNYYSSDLLYKKCKFGKWT